MLKQKQIRSFAAGLLAGGIIIFLFNLSDLFQGNITSGIIASLLFILIGGAYLYWEYKKDPQAYIKAHDEIKIERRKSKKKHKNKSK